jgi:hypothetical protein
MFSLAGLISVVQERCEVGGLAAQQQARADSDSYCNEFIKHAYRLSGIGAHRRLKNEAKSSSRVFVSAKLPPSYMRVSHLVLRPANACRGDAGKEKIEDRYRILKLYSGRYNQAFG